MESRNLFFLGFRIGFLSLVFDSVEHMFDSDIGFDSIPAGLDEMAPGPVLAAFLASIDVGELSGYDRIVVLRAHARMASHYQAQTYNDMASVVDYMEEIEGDEPQWAAESAAAEIRVALTLTRRAADAELGFALDLKQRLPRVFEALTRGDIDVRRAKTMLHGTMHLPDDTARDVIALIIEQASRLTTGQLNARIRKLCIEADPEEAQLRYDEAVAERRVVVEATTSGTANLYGYDLEPYRVAAVARKINHLARILNTRSETRSMDQLRADVYLDLLLGTNQTKTKTARGVVELRVDLETLMRLSENPGELAGYGPVIADIARHVTEQQHHSEWRFTVTDPDTGLPVANGTTRRRPTAHQRRAVETRNPTCVFPGCRMPATNCDLDHRVPWSHGGETTTSNLGPLCRHHHIIKTRAGWTLQQLPDGTHQWTSKLGHTYTTGGKPP